MSKFTPGKWWIAPPIFDGDAIFAPPQEKGRRNEVVAMGILKKADAKLIAAAPEMYRLLREFLKIDEQKTSAATEKNDPAYMMALMAQDGAVNMAKELLARIDGEEAER